MSVRTLVSRIVSRRLLDERRHQRRRAKAETTRRRSGSPHRVEFFHQVDDPYSHLLAQALRTFADRFDIELAPWLVAAPDEWAAPERERLEQYSLLDAQRLAARSGLSFPGTDRPSPQRVAAAEARAAAALIEARKEPEGPVTLLGRWIDIGEQLWSGSEPSLQDASTDVAEHTATELVLRKGTTRRDELGHYLGATCCYGGEWYWGVDRLHYLEARLEELGALHGSAESGGRIFAPPVLFEKPLPRQREQLPPLEFFLSFRSPYTYLVSEKVVDFAEQIGVELQLRFVLPMVMRSLPIQPSKRSYILQDAAREARRLGVPFGPIADPVGRPVERGYSLLPWAIEQGRGREYCLSFLRHVWSRGVDAGSKRGLRRIVEACDLDWSEALQHLDDGTWREIAEQNRQDLLDLGLWGVPSFRVGEVAVWGQDRLWVLEDEYRRLAAAHSD